MVEITLSQVAEMIGGTLIGDGTRRIRGLCPPEDPRAGMLCVIWDGTRLCDIPQDVPVVAGIGSIAGRDGVELKQPRGALVQLLPLFDNRRPEPPGIHERAFVHEGATIGAGAMIGPGCVVSEGARIGGDAYLQANVFVGRGVVIGERVRVSASVTIHDFVEIGDRVTIHSGAVVGEDGFGFVPDEDGVWRKIPQIGTVVVEDDVEIGPNSTVDRATFGVTRIRRGTKIGSLVHVAHNCDIGEDCVLVGFVGVGGSCKVGDGCILAGMSAVADHTTIGSRVTIAGRSGVTKDLRDGITVSGYPAQEHSAEMRFQASLRHVADYSARLKKVERALEDVEDRLGGGEAS